jgi:transposase
VRGRGFPLRAKIGDLSMALEGRFDEHHALMCRLHLQHLDLLEQMITKLDAQVEEMMMPFRIARELLTSIPGIGPMAAAQVIGEIGTGPQEFFATAAKLAAWSGLAPGNHESAGKRKSGRRRHGNQHLQPVLVEAAWSAVRHAGYLRSLYHRQVMNNGGYRSGVAKKKAIVTVAHAMIVIIWHVLATGTPYHELGEDYFTTRKDPEKEAQRLIAKLQALGHKVTVEPMAV